MNRLFRFLAGAGFLLAALSACQSSPAAPPTAAMIPATVTVGPSATAVVPPTATRTAAPTITPTATLDTDSMLARLGQLNKLAFVNQNQIIAVYGDRRERVVVQEMELYRSTYNIAWSPDGKKILYDSNLQIRVVRGDGTGDVRVSAGVHDSDADWSPDGRRIVFVSRRRQHDDPWLPVHDELPELYVMTAAGSGARLLLADRSLRIVAPDWSPDGKWIVFEGYDGTSERLYLIRPDGSGLQKISGDPGCSYYQPAWSPDGTRIACAVFCGLVQQLYVLAVDGKDAPALLVPYGNYKWQELAPDHPAWSPDGRFLAYEQDRWIRIVDVETHAVVILAEGTLPDWSWAGAGS